jgi:biopolymer transport protein ExbD
MHPDAAIIERQATPTLSARPRRRRSHHAQHIVVNLTSLIDVTFLLLIYFMVATDFRTREQVFRMDLPERRAAGRGADPFALDQQPLRIEVDSSEFAARAYRLRLDGPYRQPTSYDELLQILRSYQINDANTGGLFAPDHPIVIVPTATTRWEHAVEVLNAAARARYTNITFAPPAS